VTAYREFDCRSTQGACAQRPAMEGGIENGRKAGAHPWGRMFSSKLRRQQRNCGYAKTEVWLCQRICVYVEEIEKQEASILLLYATLCTGSRGRLYPEESLAGANGWFMRDRRPDNLFQAPSARSSIKPRFCISPEGDHYRTRRHPYPWKFPRSPAPWPGH